MFSAALSDHQPVAGLAWCAPVGLGYAVAPRIGVRVAGSPVADLQRLRFSATWAAAEELVALTGWPQAESHALSELLFAVIGRCGHYSIGR